MLALSSRILVSIAMDGFRGRDGGREKSLGGPCFVIKDRWDNGACEREVRTDRQRAA